MPNRVLLLYDDFKELTQTEGFLKKTGFDVLAAQNERSLLDHLLGFRPEVIVCFGGSSRVSTLSVGKKLKESLKYNGKVVLIVPKGMKLQPEELLKIKMNVLLEAPVDPEKMIKVLAKQLALNEKGLLEKLHRLQVFEKNPLKVDIANENKSPPLAQSNVGTNKSRKPSKYDKFITDQNFDKNHSTFSRTEINKKGQELLQGRDFDKEEEMGKLKIEFVKALFGKK
jgi:DNA-binding response OmpR family regulator